MQNSLPRIFDGIAASLRDVVEPAVEDPYARSQVRATIEMLANLATRVEWRCDDQSAVVARARAVLAAADEAAPAGVATLQEARRLLAEPPEAGGRNAALAAARRAHLAALAGVQAWSAAAAARGDDGARQVQAQAQAFVAWYLEQELERLRGGSL